jgi:hypothetical protein
MAIAIELYWHVEVFKDAPLLETVRMHDAGGFGQIVVCVAADDPVWHAVESGEGSSDVRAGIERFAASRRASATKAWLPRDDALSVIDDAAARWAATVDGRE